MREKVILICEKCLSRNYHYTKNKFSTKRLQLRKYCPNCKEITLHKETK